MRREGGEAQIASLLWLVEEDALFFLVVLKLSLANGVAPSLAVSRELHAILLDVAVARVLTGQITEAFQRLRRTAVEVYPMRIVGNGDTPQQPIYRGWCFP